MYKFISDPGHGWLEVSMSELLALGIANKISGYSYVTRDHSRAYLEEDCDLSTFAAAKGWSRLDEHLTYEYHENTFVRALPRFTSPEEIRS